MTTQGRTAGMRRVSLLILMVLAFATAGFAGENVWTGIGPYTAYVVDAVVADPSNPQTVYFSSYTNGPWKSADSGTTMIYIGDGMPLGGYVRDVAIDPTDPRTMYVGLFGGVCKTTDGGASWQKVSQGMAENTYVFFLAMDPSDPRTIYAHSNQGLFKSADAGGSWALIHPGPANSLSKTLAIDPKTPRILYLTTLKTNQSDAGIFKSTDGGASWTEVNREVPGVSLTIDPSNPQNVYVVASWSDSLYKSTDGGASWNLMRVKVDGQAMGIYYPTVDPTNSQTLYAVPSNSFYQGLLKSADGGASWTRFATGLPSGVKKLAQPASSPQMLYAGVNFDGVYRSTNGGNDWTKLRWAPYSGSVLAKDSSGTLYTSAGGLYRTTDGGVTWSNLNVSVGVTATHPSAPQILYCGESGAGPTPTLVRKSADGGASWKVASSGLPANPYWMVFALAAAPSASQTVYAGVASIYVSNLWSANQGGVGVYKTTDGGATWQNAGSGLPSTQKVRVLAVNPAQSQTVYAGFDTLGIYRTTDGGATWTSANAGIPAGTSVIAMVVDPSRAQTVYAGTNVGVYKSVDEGATWTASSTGLLDNTAVRAFAVDPSRAQTVYAGTTSGVYQSTDGGVSWTNFGSGLPSKTILTLALDPSAQKLYAGASPGGVQVISTAGVGGRLLADFDGNGQVNFDDFFLFAAAYGQSATGANAKYDLDGNGAIDMDDFFVFAEGFGRKAQ